MKVSSVSSQMTRPMQPGQSVRTQNQNVNNQDNKQESQSNVTSAADGESKNYSTKCNMSTEDFLKLHNTGVENMVDAIKDVMALKVLEKTLDVINKIVSD